MLEILNFIGDPQFSEALLQDRINFAKKILSETRNITARKVLEKQKIDSTHYSEINAIVRKERVKRIEKLKIDLRTGSFSL